METLKQQFDSQASDAIVHLRGRERALGAEDIRHRIEKSRGWAALRRQPARGRPKPGSPGHMSASKRPMRRVEPEPLRLRRTGLSDAAKAGEQHTPWGHTPCVPCGGWRGAAPPPDPHIANGAS